jgi:hypothetical protein
MSWVDDLGNPADWASGAWNAGGKLLNRIGLNGNTPADQAKMDRLNGVGSAGLGFAGTTQGNYNQLTGRLNGSLDALQATANGQNSVSAEQLRQGQMQNLAQQQSLAAGASPMNSAMAARTAANNIARLGYGLSGQQAVAGLQERQQAQQAYAQMLGQARGQDLQGTLGGYGVATSAYGGGLNAQRDPTLAGQIGPMLQGLGKLGGM